MAEVSQATAANTQISQPIDQTTGDAVAKKKAEFKNTDAYKNATEALKKELEAANDDATVDKVMAKIKNLTAAGSTPDPLNINSEQPTK